MTVPKTRALEVLQKMPDDSSWGQLIYRLYFVGKMDRALEEEKKGEFIPNEQVMQEMKEWLASSGSRQPVSSLEE